MHLRCVLRHERRIFNAFKLGNHHSFQTLTLKDYLEIGASERSFVRWRVDTHSELGGFSRRRLDEHLNVHAKLVRPCFVLHPYGVLPHYGEYFATNLSSKSYTSVSAGTDRLLTNIFSLLPGM